MLAKGEMLGTRDDDVVVQRQIERRAQSRYRTRRCEVRFARLR